MRNVLTIEGSEPITRSFVPTLKEGGFSVDLTLSGRAGTARRGRQLSVPALFI
jgi:hypothetical protein